MQQATDCVAENAKVNMLWYVPFLPLWYIGGVKKSGLVVGEDGRARCFWCVGSPDYQAYHDDEWGVPVHDDRRLFEKVCLEGFQAGLSWLTILRRREGFRRAFAGFDFHRVARFTPARVAKLLQDPGIIRHRGKIEATINNARCAVQLVDECGSLDAFFWRFAPPANPRRRVTRTTLAQQTTSPESVALSRELKRRGWRFVGPTTMYALMQAMGMVNDHIDGCHAGGRLRRRCS